MISLVIPVLNEKESLSPLLEEISRTEAAENLDFEILLIDDGSGDGSWAEIQRLAESNQRVSGIRFRRNFGKAAALDAGFKAARGEIICTLDADLQDDPSGIPGLIAELEKGFDVISGWKKTRYDPWHKVFPSRIFNGLVSGLTGVKLHDHNCGIKCYRAEVCKEIQLYGELHRFIPVLADARGFRVGEKIVNHRPRKFGGSKYGTWRFVKGFLDLLTVKFLTGFGGRPQHLLGALGLMAFFFGILGLGYLAFIWLMTNMGGYEFEPLHRRPLLIYSASALVVGAQLMSIGFVAELITAYQSRAEDVYSIAERVGAVENDSR